MRNTDIAIVVYTIVVLLSVMYATQPLQPLLSKEFAITMTQASYFTAVIMFFLAIAPIVYGYILEHINAKRLLMSALIILSITNILLGFSNSFETFLFFRMVEAIIIPAILTACMTILASQKEHIKRNMSFYVAATVFGGLIGRLISGFIATQLAWQYVFYSLSLALLLGLYLVSKLHFQGETQAIKPRMNDALTILKQKEFALIYLLMFTVFFVFAGVLNILPFYIKNQSSDISEAYIGLLYLGYGVGIVVSLFIYKIIAWFKNEFNTIIFGIAVLMLSMILFNSQAFWVLFAVVFVLCFGMFIVHTICTRLANSIKPTQKGLTSGMYLTFYYIGGAFGSIIPTMVYENIGWSYTLFLFLSCLALIVVVLLFHQKTFKERV
jgi:YNFM family putative membrane transporter